MISERLDQSATAGRDVAATEAALRERSVSIAFDRALPIGIAAPPPEIQIFGFGKYRVKLVPGTVPAAIISLAGVGNPDGDDRSGVDMRFEWEGTLRRLRRPEHLIFVQDTGRSWFNDTTGWEGLVSCIRRYVAACGIQRTTLIGLSMGGTGALILGRDIENHLVIALSPQALIDPELAPWDRRFWDLRCRIRHFRVPDTSGALRPDGNYRLIFSFDDAVDMRHATVFARKLQSNSLSVVRGGHNVGHEMARRQVLDDFMFDLIEGHHDDLRRYGIFVAGEDVLDIAGKAPADSAAKILKVGMSRPAVLPAFCYRQYQDGIFDLFLKRGLAYPDVMALVPYPMHTSQVVAPNDFLLYAVHGWAPDDLWSIGRHHVIRTRIMDLATFPLARLVLTVEPFVNARYRSQRVFVAINGRPVTDTLAEYREGADNKLTITIEKLSPIVELHIETPDFISPQQLGLSSDDRPLGVRLVGIETFPF